jgi:hypothetical protein
MYEPLLPYVLLGSFVPLQYITSAAAAFTSGESFGSSSSSSAQRWNHGLDLGILFSSPTAPTELPEQQPYADTDDEIRIKMLLKYAEEVPRDELWIPADSINEARQLHRHGNAKRAAFKIQPSRHAPATRASCARQHLLRGP